MHKVAAYHQCYWGSGRAELSAQVWFGIELGAKHRGPVRRVVSVC